MGRAEITKFDYIGANHGPTSLGGTGLEFVDLHFFCHGGGFVLDGSKTLHLVNGGDLFMQTHIRWTAATCATWQRICSIDPALTRTGHAVMIGG